MEHIQVPMALCVPAAFRVGFWEFLAGPSHPGLGWDLFHSLAVCGKPVEIHERPLACVMSITFLLL